MTNARERMVMAVSMIASTPWADTGASARSDTNYTRTKRDVKVSVSQSVGQFDLLGNDDPKLSFGKFGPPLPTQEYLETSDRLLGLFLTSSLKNVGKDLPLFTLFLPESELFNILDGLLEGSTLY